MERFKLKVEVREGKSRDRVIPAVVYGAGIKNTSISVDQKDFNKLYQKAGESSLVDLEIKGSKKSSTVLIHEVQRNPVSDEVIHIDFFGVNMKKKIRTEIPIKFIGNSSAVEEGRGIFNKNLDSLEVESLPGDLPHEIKVDISVLKNVGDHIGVKEIPAPSQTEILTSRDLIVASIVEKKVSLEPVAEPEKSPESSGAEAEKKSTAPGEEEKNEEADSGK